MYVLKKLYDYTRFSWLELHAPNTTSPSWDRRLAEGYWMVKGHDYVCLPMYIMWIYVDGKFHWRSAPNTWLDHIWCLWQLLARKGLEEHCKPKRIYLNRQRADIFCGMSPSNRQAKRGLWNNRMNLMTDGQKSHFSFSIDTYPPVIKQGSLENAPFVIWVSD